MSLQVDYSYDWGSQAALADIDKRSETFTGRELWLLQEHLHTSATQPEPQGSLRARPRRVAESEPPKRGTRGVRGAGRAHLGPSRPSRAGGAGAEGARSVPSRPVPLLPSPSRPASLRSALSLPVPPLIPPSLPPSFSPLLPPSLAPSLCARRRRRRRALPAAPAQPPQVSAARRARGRSGLRWGVPPFSPAESCPLPIPPGLRAHGALLRLSLAFSLVLPNLVSVPRRAGVCAATRLVGGPLRRRDPSEWAPVGSRRRVSLLFLLD